MKRNVVGMILAAGFGTRLKELTAERPKPLMELGTKAIIYHQIQMLEKAGVEDIYINLHYQSHYITTELNSWHTNARLHFSFEEKILGTAGGIRQVIRQFDLLDRPMIVLHGDVICDIDLKSVVFPQAFCNLIIAENRHLEGYHGSVSVDNHSHIIELGSFYTSDGVKVKSGFFTGIHYLSSDALQLLKNTSHTCLVSEVYPEWLKSGKVILGDVREMMYEDLGTPKRLLESNISMCKFPNSFMHYNFIENMGKMNHKNILTGNQVAINPSATLIEPLIIGDHVTIEAGALIGPNVVVGKNSLIGCDAHVSNSVIMSETVIEKDERLDCVIALSKARVLVRDIKND